MSTHPHDTSGARPGPYYINPVTDHPETLGWEVCRGEEVVRYIEAMADNANRPAVVGLVTRMNNKHRAMLAAARPLVPEAKR